MTNPMHKALAALKHAPRCGANCRTTGHPCRNAAMKNGRCRMHGGRSTGRPVIHGRATNRAKQEQREVRELLRTLRELLLAKAI